MRAYSQSQGKFVDLPDQPTGGSSVGGGQDYGEMKKVFAALTLSNPKRASTYKSVVDLLEPSEAEKKKQGEQTENITSIQNLLEDFTSAEDLMQKSGSGIQYSGAGFRSKLPDWLGGLGDEASATSTQFSDINTRLFETAGKAFTGPEKALLRGLILDMSKNPAGNQATINQARTELERKLAEYGVEPKTKSKSITSTSKKSSGRFTIEAIE